MATNHATNNPDLAIYDIVKTRIPLLVESDANKQTLSILTYELMHEMEPYFQVDTKPVPDTDPVETYEVGDEAGYTVAQKSLLADLVAIQVLGIVAAGGTIAGTSGGGESGEEQLPAGVYLKSAKAGTVQVEYGLMGGSSSESSNEGGLSMLQGSQRLMARLKRDAVRKGHNMGLIIDINADEEIAIRMAQEPPFLPFKTTPFS